MLLREAVMERVAHRVVIEARRRRREEARRVPHVVVRLRDPVAVGEQDGEGEMIKRLVELDARQLSNVVFMSGLRSDRFGSTSFEMVSRVAIDTDCGRIARRMKGDEIDLDAVELQRALDEGGVAPSR